MCDGARWATMDPRNHQVALGANIATIVIVFIGLINQFIGGLLGHSGLKFLFISWMFDNPWGPQGWSLQETIALVMVIGLQGIVWWAKQENETPVVHAHLSAEEQYAARDNAPTVAYSQTQAVNPNTAAVISSIVGLAPQQDTGAVSAAIDHLSQGEIGAASAAIVAQTGMKSAAIRQTGNSPVPMVVEVKSMALPDLDEILEEPVESNKPEFIEKNDLPELPDF